MKLIIHYFSTLIIATISSMPSCFHPPSKYVDSSGKFGDCVDGYWKADVWVPNCPYHEFTTDSARKCLNKKTLLISGTSVSRGLFRQLVDLIDGRPISPEVNRSDEKRYIDYIFGNIDCTKKSKDKIRLEMSHMCKFHTNYPNNIVVHKWSDGFNSGKIKFFWCIDWYHSHFAKYLKNPNTIVSNNAGLNAYGYQKMITNGNVSVVASQVIREFPLLWKSPVHKSSMLIYRQTTATQCEDCAARNLYLVPNFLIRDFYLTSPKVANKRLLNFDFITLDGTHFEDCVHHGGRATQVELNMLLSAACSGVVDD
jgi:hypothetical protein